MRSEETATYESVSATSVIEVAPAPTEKTFDEPSDKTFDEPSELAVDEPAEQHSSYEKGQFDEEDEEGALGLSGDGYDSDDDLENDDQGSSRNALVRCVSVNKDARIMIVDDEPLNIMTFRQHLKLEGYQRFVSTTDASEALAMAKRELPDVLLLDVHMPRISGLDILRVMGLDPVLQHIPVLILTAATDPAIRKSALDLGASDFLTKPIDPNELLPRVRNAITLKTHYDMVANQAARLEQQVERRTRQLNRPDSS
ncbi:MAG: response regulator [Fuerstiella sp.]